MELYQALVYEEEYFTPQGAAIWKRFKVCERMKWDLSTYCRQPRWFIDQLWACMNTEAAA